MLIGYLLNRKKTEFLKENIKFLYRSLSMNDDNDEDERGILLDSIKNEVILYNLKVFNFLYNLI